MKNPNGYGGVSRLPGNRRRPYRVRITVGWERRVGEPPLQQYATIGYFATQSEALLALAEYNNSPFNALMRDITLRQVYDRWSPRHFEKFPSTRRLTESAMAHCASLWDMPMRELRTVHLQEVINGMDGLSREYQAKVRSLIHQLYEWCVKNDVLNKDYSQYIELTRPIKDSTRRVFTPEEIEAVRKLCRDAVPIPEEPELYRGRCMMESVLILLYTGLRIGELLSLRRRDIHLEERYIDLHGTKTRAARRLVPLHRDIVPVLQYVMEKSSSEFLLPAPGGGGMTYSQYKYSWFDKVFPAVGLEHNPHDTRHTFISALDTAGVSRSTQKFIVGHSLSRDVTDHYTHKNLDELIRAIDMLKL